MCSDVRPGGDPDAKPGTPGREQGGREEREKAPDIPAVPPPQRARPLGPAMLRADVVRTVAQRRFRT
jgi:hypothetical protein